VIRRRTRAGTAGLVTTGTPSAASVGANAPATRRVSHRPIPGKSHAPSAHPAATVSGSPRPSNLAYMPRSPRRSCTRTRAASAKSTQTRVSSTIGLSVSGAVDASTKADAARHAPTATNAMGAATLTCVNLADTIAQAKMVAVTNSSAVVSTPTSTTRAVDTHS
jgi:hypothetical protein